MGFPGSSDVKETACNARDLDSISASGRSPGEGNSKPFLYSCLENFMVRGIPWTEEPGGLFGPWGHKKLDMTEQLTHKINTP